ncbi:hypothetical protein BXZ70DRAFT_900556 [Cristinia sonorae]|uniref:Spo11/DNA topoisomerase VI subunit A N-terminal domain-containing protein n=1 Tax=Cristinia sonorae TaxID=1940300 RepID=A0A8K0XKN1_9AGAR|nr:hypothetical protein BXZ70DRAFT_900556 [Cristinia sonorae]
MDTEEFSSNRSLTSLASRSSPADKILSRHPDLCFNDGNIAILAGDVYFIVHRGPLGRHSPVLKSHIEALSATNPRCIEGLPTLVVPYGHEDMSYFLRTLYGFPTPHVGQEFRATSAILRLATAYEVNNLRSEIIRRLSQGWPATLAQWEVREKSVVNKDGVYAPRPKLPHPIVVIAIAREMNAPHLLPSAFYDLSRYLPSQVANGYNDPTTLTIHRLPDDDLFRVFRGKEQTARFFSTFIVNELEGRMPSQFCTNRKDIIPSRKRSCQVAFETITLSILRDANGMILNHNSDPLFAIADSLAMQTKEDAPGMENVATYRACEACRLEFSAVVQDVREEFWRRLPEWFDLPNYTMVTDFDDIFLDDLNGDVSPECLGIAKTKTDVESLYLDVPLDSPSLVYETSDDMSIDTAIKMNIDAFGLGDDADLSAEEEEEEESEDDDPKSLALGFLEDLTLDFLTQLCEALERDDSDRIGKDSKHISLQLANRNKQTMEDGSFATKLLTFPRKAQNISSSKPLAQLFKVVDLMHESLTDNLPSTKRDMFYKDVQLFKRQSVLVDDLAATAGLGRADLNVRASAKGLFCGASLTIHLRSGETLYGNDSEVCLWCRSREIHQCPP